MLDGPQESVAPPVQAADGLVVFPRAVGVCLADLEAGGRGEVVEEGFRGVGEGDAARVGVGGRGAVEELGERCGAEVPGVAAVGLRAGAVVDVFWVSS